jgi:hypothetical protein
MAHLYQIVCPEALQPAIQCLIEQKLRRGYRVSIKTVQDFGSPPNPDQIRSFIRSCSPRWYLLVGDYDLMPAFPLTGYTSDAYFGMGDDEKVPLVPCGRISSNDPAIVEAICERLVAYETTAAGSWTKRAILTGWMPRCQQEVNAGQSCAGTECVQAIGSHFSVTRRFENDETASGTYIAERRAQWGVANTSKTDLIDAINAGALIIRYLGHGSRYEWSNIGRKNATVDEKLTTDDIRALNVGSRLPLVISAACSTGNLVPATGFAETWQVAGKAVGIFAADTTTLTYWDDRITQAFFTQIVSHRQLSIGDMLIAGMRAHFATFGDRGIEYMKAYTANRYLGDPDTVLLDLREDKLSFDPGSLEVRCINGRWKVVDGSSWLIDTASNEGEARTAYEVLRKYGFRCFCYVGRPDPSLTYLLK